MLAKCFGSAAFQQANCAGQAAQTNLISFGNHMQTLQNMLEYIKAILSRIKFQHPYGTVEETSSLLRSDGPSQGPFTQTLRSQGEQMIGSHLISLSAEPSSLSESWSELVAPVSKVFELLHLKKVDQMTWLYSSQNLTMSAASSYKASSLHLLQVQLS